ncbi:succinyldiaminopimelate aminotransferase apoenzyme [Lampropedia hyalina DSM 16112]|jgi:N-succinyldiaminopimelate aminotransferase|uniref:Succinyldiaminopimelate aminotransferase apoenzyme n=1 Tax=Lampropedia hyalina DSM 16112 TaxID=1122156 RepID=A0A1M5C001_9BURK|nr:succinyldiaminopimelate transaminase [Lampropedia hyalina]SHF47937.1 succinyldiaminopimelate aminotransferase apoenzyme [Lampropedia hyalina DSM 16112]
MNLLLQDLHPYPFERLRQLLAGTQPNPALAPISLGIGEPKHATPAFILQAYAQALQDPATGLAAYPATAGTPALREAFARWLQQRYGVAVDALTQTLPVNGSREALFAFAQAVVDASAGDAVVVCPNPFYQIYEGAAILAGATPFYANSDPARNFAVDWDSVPESIWQRTRLLYVCSPGNPTGAVMPLEEWRKLFALSDAHGFVIASDECYSEIYFRYDAPLGGLQAAQQLGRTDFRNLVTFTSLSKRSNVPGMRSGFVAGDAAILQKFLLYRTYHGCAMAPPVQAASVAAWGDEAHVQHNRDLYRQKFAQVTPVLAEVMDVSLPDAGFYLWAGIPAHWGQDDTRFAQQLHAQYNVTVLPGSYLARQTPAGNPGAGRVRMALVASTEECLEAARRIARFIRQSA